MVHNERPLQYITVPPVPINLPNLLLPLEAALLKERGSISLLEMYPVAFQLDTQVQIPAERHH